VSAVLLVAAATVAVIAWLTTLVGLAIALGLFVVLVVVAVALAILTRPQLRQQSEPEAKVKPQPSGYEKPKDASPPVQKESQVPKPVQKEVPKPVQKEVPMPKRVSSPRLGEIYRGAASRPHDNPIPSPPSQPTPAPRSFKEELIRRRCQVAAGVLTTVKLPVANGNYVYGHLREVDGYEFTWAIVDVKNLGLMERKLRFLVQRGERDVATATIEWTVPSDGPWFLAFDATGKQYVRQVAVELWRRILE